jgi:hypothetical protein
VSAVPERDAVDRCLKSARDLTVENNPHNLHGWGNPDNRLLAQIIVDCTEAIVRQIRDADDTIATVLTPALENNLADLVVATNGIQLTLPEKKGMF